MAKPKAKAKTKSKPPAKSAPKKKAVAASPVGQGASAQPLFFKSPVPLLKDRHADAGLALQDATNFKFARKTNSIPINMQEFSEAAKDYPIVFTGAENPIPVCILGVESDKNLFVNAAGKWLEETYVPAYVRRYPFAFTSDNTGDKLLLCVDEESELYVKKAKKKDSKFFEKNGDQAELTQRALSFCKQYNEDMVETHAFCKALTDKGLLKERQLSVQLEKDKEPRTMSGFKTVDEEAFRNLPKDILHEWHKNGYLGVLYFHLLSTTNWSRISRMA